MPQSKLAHTDFGHVATRRPDRVDWKWQTKKSIFLQIWSAIFSSAIFRHSLVCGVKSPTLRRMIGLHRAKDPTPTQQISAYQQRGTRVASVTNSSRDWRDRPGAFCWCRTALLRCVLVPRFVAESSLEADARWRTDLQAGWPRCDLQRSINNNRQTAYSYGLLAYWPANDVSIILDFFKSDRMATVDFKCCSTPSSHYDNRAQSERKDVSRCLKWSVFPVIRSLLWSPPSRKAHSAYSARQTY